jgi:hypothetical protein
MLRTDAQNTIFDRLIPKTPVHDVKKAGTNSCIPRTIVVRSRPSEQNGER